MSTHADVPLPSRAKTKYRVILGRLIGGPHAKVKQRFVLQVELMKSCMGAWPQTWDNYALANHRGCSPQAAEQQRDTPQTAEQLRDTPQTAQHNLRTEHTLAMAVAMRGLRQQDCFFFIRFEIFDRMLVGSRSTKVQNWQNCR